MDGLRIVWALLGITGIVLGIVLALTLWQLRKTLQNLETAVIGTMKQLEMTAEEVRKTNTVFLQVVERVERSTANIEYVTEGVRDFRSTLDAATSVLKFAVVPVLGNAAAGLAGVRAGLSHVLNRWFGKEKGNE